MAPSRAPISQESNVTDVYALSLLSEYTHTLDSLPLDLSRNFADLRELDAVLSSSMTSITAKIQNLTKMIEDGTVAKQDRLFLLTDIAEEAARLKLGGEDKIRVACQAADNLKSHTSHMRTLLTLLPSFDVSALNRKTTYPHVAVRSYMPTIDNSRRRRGNYGSIMNTANHEASPSKRKRATREDDVDVGGGRSPRKERTNDGTAQRSRNGARSRKQERAASPTESVLSVISHTVAPVSQAYAGTSRAGGSSSRATNPSSRRSKPNPNTYDEPHVNGSVNGRRDIFPAPPSSSVSHPSLPIPYGSNGLHSYDLPGAHTLANDWGAPPLGQLEGPGMPVARNTHTGLSISSATVLTPSLPLVSPSETQAGNAAGDTATEVGEGDGEGDDRTYCFCEGISYGEMIACDDVNCEREWFHLACIGLTVPPDGTWFCDACRQKKNAKRGSRANKKRSGGGGGSTRSGGKAANNG
jgi:inhibitor of growth protein 3